MPSTQTAMTNRQHKAKRVARQLLNSGYAIISKRPSTNGIAQFPLKEDVEEETVILVHRPMKVIRPWRLTAGGLRAFIDLVTAGVVYLLWARSISIVSTTFADT